MIHRHHQGPKVKWNVWHVMDPKAAHLQQMESTLIQLQGQQRELSASVQAQGECQGGILIISN